MAKRPVLGIEEFDRLSALAESAQDRLKTLLVRGTRADVFAGFGDRVFDPSTPLGGLVDRPPTLEAKATKETDGSRIRMVLLRVETTDGGRAAGTTASLFSADGQTLLDSAQIDRRGLVLLRFPRGTGADMAALEAEIALGTATPRLTVSVPQGRQHLVVHAAIDPADAVGASGETVKTASETVESASGTLGTARGSLDGAIAALESAVEALAGAGGSGVSTVGDAVEDTGEAVEDVTTAARALESASSALDAAASALSAGVPVDSVISRLPVSFSSELADSITSLLAVAEGPIPGIDTVTEGISTSRMPLFKQFVLRRRVVQRDPDGRIVGVRRFLVRVQQEWVFVGITLGELVRVDALDPASITGTLDATLTADVQAGLTLDASSASRLQAALSGRLSAHAAIDSALDVALRARLETDLDAGLGLGLFPQSGIRGLGLLGLDAQAELDANFNFDAHVDLSVRSSLLVAARINAAASLVNQVRVQVSAALEAQATVNAKLVAQINPSLARAVNLLRFVLYDVYAVTSQVEDVLEFVEEKVFGPVPQFPLLFPPADIVEYRPFFQPVLLEPQLAGNFRLLRHALSQLRSGGEPIRSIQVVVEYTASGPGGDLTVRFGSQAVTLRLRSGLPTAVGTLRLQPPLRPNDLAADGARLTLASRLERVSSPIGQLFPPVQGTAEVARVEIRYDGSAFLDDLGIFPQGGLSVGPSRLTAQGTVQLTPRPLDFNPFTDSLVLHVNRNPHYYLAVLALTAMRVPSLRIDAPQLAGIGIDHPIWRLPLLGFVGDRALILVEPPAGDPVVAQLVEDEGTSTIVQLAAAGLYTESAQGKMEIAEVAGLAHPALALAQPPLPNFSGLDVLSNAGGVGSPNLNAALASAAPLLQQSPSLANLAALANLLATAQPPEAPDTPDLPGL